MAEPTGAPREPLAPGDGLVAHAHAVLDGNWMGHATSPSLALYPHQWSWDSAFVAIGYVHLAQDRAETELRSLLAGQWRSGLVPHIVFVDGTSPYFPGPEVWAAQRSDDAPARPHTSGIVQPPVHASAVWHVYQHSSDRRRATEFLQVMLPRLAEWHAYLYRERTRAGGALAEIWHPWESGMDNSPLWDSILARIDPASDLVPPNHRHDVKVSDPAERPSDAEYHRYLHLVQLFRDCRYDATEIRAASPFAVHDVLFNSVLVQANRDLAAIAREVGAGPEPYEEWADATARAIDEQLWRDGLGYVDVDVVTGEAIHAPVWSRFSPLFAGVPTGRRADHLLDELVESMVTIDGVGPAVPSLAPDDPRFEPARYWRGPIWINVNWFLYHGLHRYGRHDVAASLRTTMIELARRSGFTEHYNPLTGRGHGGTEFAWSAALVLDLLHQR